MKVAFVGNVCNFSYWFAKWGQELGFDTHAIIEADNQFSRDRPDWEDPSYDPKAPPPWVHFYRAGNALERGIKGTVDPNLVGLLRRFDSVQTLSPAASIAVGGASYEGSYFHHTIGSFARTTRWPRRPDAADGSGIAHLLAAVSPRRIPTVARFRSSLRKARKVVVSTAIEHHEVGKSAFGGKMIALPIGYDVASADPYAETRARKGAVDDLVTFFLPARQHWAFKGQNLVLQAFASLSPAERRRSRLLLLDWGVDRERSRALVADLRLEALTTFAPMMKKHELWETLARPDVVVVDQFPVVDLHGGGLGGVARDALSVGAPVITHARPSAQTTIFSAPPPVFHAEPLATAIAEQLRACLAMRPADLTARGWAGRAWIQDECDFRHVMPLYISMHRGP